jgi:hypothetical protein
MTEKGSRCEGFKLGCERIEERSREVMDFSISMELQRTANGA